MPLPKPKKDEKEKDYIPRCMSYVSDHGTLQGKEIDLKNENDRKRALAACYTTYKNKNEENDFIRKLEMFETTSTNDVDFTPTKKRDKKKKKGKSTVLLRRKGK